MEYKFTIRGRMPCLNDYLAAERVTFRCGQKGFTTKGNDMKKKAQKDIIWSIRRDLKALKIEKPVVILYKFYEQNKKRDLDNIASFGMKVIQDSLVLSGVLQNDGWNYIKGFNCDFDVDKDNPRIEVTLQELED
jgi:Holliday junction resolvase RusA-like endonuclease